MNKLLILSLLFAVVLFGCAKDGEPGPPGKDGIDGNANVVSISKTIIPEEWIMTGTEGVDLMCYASINVPEITSSILNSGTVIVFNSWDNGTFFEALPSTYYFGEFDTNLTYTYDLSRVTIWVADSDLLTVPPGFDLSIRIVVISGNLATSNLNLEDYKVVETLLAK